MRAHMGGAGAHHHRLREQRRTETTVVVVQHGGADDGSSSGALGGDQQRPSAAQRVVGSLTPFFYLTCAAHVALVALQWILTLVVVVRGRIVAALTVRIFHGC